MSHALSLRSLGIPRGYVRVVLKAGWGSVRRLVTAASVERHCSAQSAQTEPVTRDPLWSSATGFLLRLVMTDTASSPRSCTCISWASPGFAVWVRPVITTSELSTLPQAGGEHLQDAIVHKGFSVWMHVWKLGVARKTTRISTCSKNQLEKNIQHVEKRVHSNYCVTCCILVLYPCTFEILYLGSLQGFLYKFWSVVGAATPNIKKQWKLDENWIGGWKIGGTMSLRSKFIISRENCTNLAIFW